jgi:hypothetical protein
MLHADHTYERSPWWSDLQNKQRRGLGAELRLLGMNPEGVAERARGANALFKDISVRGHGWREVMVRDPDGYVWGWARSTSPGRSGAKTGVVWCRRSDGIADRYHSELAGFYNTILRFEVSR